MKKSLLLVTLLVVAAVFARFDYMASAQKPNTTVATAKSNALEERIKRVENGLLPAAVIKGAPPAGSPLTERLEYYRVPGLSIAVVNDGRVEWARGYGLKDATTKEPVTTETLFQAGSISKPVAALAALKLVEQGKLSLDEDVNAKLVSWKLLENEFTKDQKVTLRRLLTHNAGLTVHGFPGYVADAPVPTLVQVLNGEKPANTSPIRVDTVPGTIWRYSGGGYTIMQQLLIDVMKRPFPEIMRSVVLEPVGMTHSTYEQPPPPPRAAQAATAHNRGEAVKGRYHTYPEMAAAGLWTTPTDLALLVIELQKSLAGKSNRILSKSMTTQMLSKQFQNWGLGPSVSLFDQTIEFSHGGSDEGFEAYWVGFSDGRGAAVMTNGDRGSELAMEVLRSLSREYGWPDFQPKERVVATVNPKIYESYVGDYEFKINPTLTVMLTVSTEGGKLLVQQNGGAKREWLPSSETDYFSLASGNTFHFSRDEQGRVTELTVFQDGEKYTGKKIK
jgi:CubicO group peptidase (beta-lactamase class C family)